MPNATNPPDRAAFIAYLTEVLCLPGNVAPDASLEHDLGLDSIALLELVYAVEALGVKLEHDEVGRITSLDSAYETFRGVVARGEAQPDPAS